MKALKIFRTCVKIKMPLIYIIIMSELVFQVHSSRILLSPPVTYPQRADVTIDAGTDLTIGCRGAEPVVWSFKDDINGPHYNASMKSIIEIYSMHELLYKYETLLTIYNVSYVNTGTYYCSGEKVDFDTPRRSTRIYVFIYDDNRLSVLPYDRYPVTYNRWFMSFPCRPTSQYISVILSCGEGRDMTVNSQNYSKVFYVEGDSIRFHPYYGFQIYMGLTTLLFWNCSCGFKKEEETFSITFETDQSYITKGTVIYPPVINGPSTANVGDTIQLQCTYIVEEHFPYYKYDLHWNLNSRPISGKKMFNFQIIKLKNYSLLIHTLILKNISSRDEGNYECNSDDFFIPFNGNKYVFINDIMKNYSKPRIVSPNQKEIQKQTFENITLQCAGSNPITWDFFNQVNISHNIEYISNLENGLYITYLHLIELQYEDTGFYYCHENDSVRDHPYKSDQIYIFVEDNQNLYVVPQAHDTNAYPYENITVPCLPTSQNINVSIAMVSKFDNNYSIQSYASPVQMDNIKYVKYGFDPREGFTIQMPNVNLLSAVCTFISKTINSTQHLLYRTTDYGFVKAEPFINGPDEDFVVAGETLKLSCTIVVYYNVPDDILQWITPNNFTAHNIHTEVETIKVFGGKVLINKLVLYNTETINEGRYFCYSMYNNATAVKYISVDDAFGNVKPFIKMSYDYAYIGLSLHLPCQIKIDHNTDFILDWEYMKFNKYDNVKFLNMQYTPQLRYTQGENILLIDHVTHENEGNYSCFVSDSSKRKKYVTETIRVKRGKKPQIVIKNLKEYVVLQEQTVNLFCFSEGDPKPVLIWMKGATEVRKIDEHINLLSNNSELIIHNVQSFDEGLYTCEARNPFGVDIHSLHLRVEVPKVPTFLIVSCSIIIFVAIVVSYKTAKYTEKKFRKRKELVEAGVIDVQSSEIQNTNPVLNTTEHTTLLLFDTKWEIPRDKIKLGHNLGAGCFGLVVKAMVSNFFEEESIKTVAVKMLHKHSNFVHLNSLLSELKLMTQLGKHINLINLLGACWENITERKLLIVIEYCKYGNLKNYVTINRCNFTNLIDPNTELIDLHLNYRDTFQDPETSHLSTLNLLCWAFQIARGMEFLTTEEVVHGDLAARNILLTENNVVKISDFGLSRNVCSSGYYKKTSQCPLPIKWMAIEAIRDKTFSAKSDVWSFGIVLWELFSLGRTPYPEMELDLQFYQMLERGYRLYKPQYSTKEIYQVMQECWHAQPDFRPSFTSLVYTLGDFLPDDICTQYRTLDHGYENMDIEQLAEQSSSAYQNIVTNSIYFEFLGDNIITSVDL